MIRQYYFNNQLRKFILGFMNIFVGLEVNAGKDNVGESIQIEVPIRYGSMDRVVSAISSGDTQNKLHTLPMMACYMNNLSLAPDRMHGVNQVDRRTYLEQGGIFPDEVKVIQRVVPIPYNMEMELSIYTSNTQQLFQIIEQVLILFDYDMQIQFNDAPFDWTRLSKVTLTGLQNEEVYPVGTDRRAVIWTLQFEVPIWISPPINIRSDIIKNINLRISHINENSQFDEIGVDGELVPFDQVVSTIQITSEDF